MSEHPVIRTMTRDDLDFAIRLAAKEGWNPGLSDADCFSKTAASSPPTSTTKMNPNTKSVSTCFV